MLCSGSFRRGVAVEAPKTGHDPPGTQWAVPALPRDLERPDYIRSARVKTQNSPCGTAPAASIAARSTRRDAAFYGSSGAGALSSASELAGSTRFARPPGARRGDEIPRLGGSFRIDEAKLGIVLALETPPALPAPEQLIVLNGAHIRRADVGI